MHRLVAAVAIVLLLASCYGRMGIAGGSVMMVAGGIGMAVGPVSHGDRSGNDSCEEAHGYCGPSYDLEYEGPTPGLMTFLLGAANVALGLATLRHENRRRAEEDRPLAVEEPPKPPRMVPKPLTADRPRDGGTWRDVPAVPGDDADE